MSIPGGRQSKRIVLELVGWLLVVVGIAALVLPGPGLLMLFGGMAILSQQYEWADKRLQPVEQAAKEAARQGVSTIPRIAMSLGAIVIMIGIAITWGIRPAAPSWWPLRESWWLPGGWGMATSLILSALIALGLLIYSIKRFRD